MDKFIAYHLFSFFLVFAIVAIVYLSARSLNIAIFCVWAAAFGVIAICITSGILSVIKLNQPYIPAIINFLVVFVIVVFTKNIWRNHPLVTAAGAGIITFLAAGITIGIRFAAINFLLQLKLLIALPLMLFVALCLYLEMAYLSQLAYSPFNEKWFYKYPTDDHLKLQCSAELSSRLSEGIQTDYRKTEILYNIHTKKPYTGIAYNYTKQLKIDLAKPKPTELFYFIEGCYVGHTAKPGNVAHFSGWDNVQKCSSGFSPHTQRLLHKDYAKILEAELASWNNYSVVSADELSPRANIDFWGAPDIVIIHMQENIQCKKEIALHSNGLIREIRPYILNNTGEWQDAGRLLMFDSLGFCTCDAVFCANGALDYHKDKKTVWDVKDFIFVEYYTDFTGLSS